MAEGGESFGQGVYSELRRLAGFNELTSRLDYTGIQRLKAADRAGTAQLFAAGGPELIRLIEEAEPADVAEYLVREAERAGHAAERAAWGLTLVEFLAMFLGT
jgi:hypothetical protein